MSTAEAQGDGAPDAARSRAQQTVRDLRARLPRLDDDGLDLILREARSHYAWRDEPVSEAEIRTLYDVVKMGPTSMNGCPARFVFVTSKQAKERLAACVNPGNVAKMMTAPVTVIVAHDVEFWRYLVTLHPHDDRRGMFADNPAKAETAAFRNATLQGAYLIIAARALGYDVGAMSGFSNAKVDAEFFAGTSWRSNFLCNIGHADETALFHRLPRFGFEEACEII